MTVDAAILRSRLVREHSVVGHVIRHYPVAVWKGVDCGLNAPKVAQQRVNGNVHNVVAEPATIWPAARDEPSVAKRILDLALQQVVAEDAQP